MSLKTLSYNKGSSRSFAGGRNSAVSVPVGDPYYNQVGLLLTGNGPNNGNNSVFLDSSTNNFTITRAGNVTHTSFSPVTGGFSGYFNGSTDFLSLPSNAAFTLDGDFTIEAWVNVATPAAFAGIFSTYPSSGTANGVGLTIKNTGAVEFNIGRSGLANTITSSTILVANTWYHIAAVLSGTAMTLYINGVSAATGTRSVGAVTLNTPVVGRYWSDLGGNVLNGYIDDVRVLKGTALYTGAFTPPTTPLTAITNTSLLLNFANGAILDASTRKLPVVTVSGAKTVTTLSKYGTASMAFNGTTDYLTIPSNAAFNVGTGDHTLECWIYPTSFPSTWRVFTRGDGNGSLIGDNTGALAYYYTGASTITIAASGGVQLNTWNHIAVSRASGTTRIFLNGVQKASVAESTSMGTTDIVIGSWSGGTQLYAGYIDDLRFTNGAARYVTNFTPPQQESLTFYSPPTYDEYTYNGEVPVSGDPFYDSVQLLLRGNAANGLGNSTVLDKSGNNVTITINGSVSQGSVAPSNEQFSAYFPGGGGNTLTTSSMTIGTSAFTIEWWFYPSSSIVSNSTFFLSASGILVGFNGTSAWGRTNQGSWTGATTSSTLPVVNQWNHMAVVREGTGSNQEKLYLNGVLVATGTNSTNYTATTYTLGSTLVGYISDFRLTNSAVYTTTFTPPTTKLTAVTNTTLLLNFDNVGIYDSVNKVSLTTAGTASISTVQKKYGAGSMYFDGSSYATAPSSTSLNLGTSNFTIEAWIYSTGLGAERTIVAKHNNQAGNGGWALCTSSSNFPIFYYSVTGTNLFSVTSNTAITANTWHHVAITRSGSTFTIWLNGINCGTSADSSTIFASSTALNVGRYLATAATQSPWLGYIDDVRITKGAARYLGNFTPPTAQLPNYYEEPSYDPYFSSVSLLLHGDGSNNQNNSTILDSSISNKTVTRVTGVSQGSFSPFPVAANVSEYSVSTNSGSLYFNGTNAEYCTVPASTDWVFAGDHTLECWVYITIAGGGGWIYSTGGSGTNDQFIISANNGGNNGSIAWAFALNGNLYLTTTANIPINQWNHIAISRTGTTMTAWVNGTNVYTGTISGSIGQNSTAHIGRRIDGNGSTYFTGYISNFRIINGTGLYTSNFTVPNVPLTSITNTKLLLKGENSAIYDSATKNNLIVSGNTKTMVAVNKYGGSSIYFDGVGDWITAPHSTNLTFGSNDFTIECWLYTPGTGNPSGVWGKKTISGYGIALQNYLLVPNLTVSVNGTTWGINNSSSISLTANAWNHVAVVRNGDTYTLYVNGLSGWSGTLAGTVYDNSLPFVVGSVQNDGAYVYSGYIDDFRFTKGVARYTANFVPPTSAFRNR